MQKPTAKLQGNKAEAQACAYLETQGLNLVARNFRTRQGEIDLVMRERDILVFVEVRYRGGDTFGSAGESITPLKQARIRHAAAQFLQQHADYRDSVCRFDIVTFDRDRTDWLKDAFE